VTDQADVDSRDGDDDDDDERQELDRDAKPERDDHLADVEPGAGCTEVWEHLSEYRNGDGPDEE
jgi:hypothetical protein